MPTVATPMIVNLLLERLPRAERKQILALCEPVDLVFGSVLSEPDAPLHYLYFPLSGFISLVTRVAHHQPLEIALIGNEGVLGATIALGITTAPLRSVVQGSGTALRISAASVAKHLQHSSSLDRLLRRYLYVMMIQLARTTACTRFHDTDARLACWLLMTHDRAHADHFHLTHEFLAGMLGVRRSGLTIAAGKLQRGGFIKYSRGMITVLDRGGLEAQACECYAAIRNDYIQTLRS